ncbi:MAG: class I SAM-dependent methyltransferase [Candidatus Pacebacteria bacterium]|nr:class I SAM-dependent methyltransferase [Candidatus Paceibacterota bacterium]
MEIITYIKKIIPKEIKISVKQIISNLLFVQKYKFLPPPPFTDMSGYEFLLDTIVEKRLYRLEGDFVEIGTFIGGGTYKLSKLLEKLQIKDKKIYVIDTFDLSQKDHTIEQWRRTLKAHKQIIKNKKQYEVYKKITKNCKNLVTLINDSKNIMLPCKKISFAYIDGNHSYEYVKNDFYLVWDKLVSNGIVAFHDYNFEEMGTVKAIHELIGEQSDKILRIWINDLKSTVLIQKK